MNEHRSSTSEGIWIGLCVLLLVIVAAAGAFGFIQHRQVAGLSNTARLLTEEMQSERDLRHEVTERSADLSLKVRDMEQRVGELEDENHELREQLGEAAQ